MKNERTYTRKQLMEVVMFIFSAMAITRGAGFDYVEKMMEAVELYLEDKIDKGL